LREALRLRNVTTLSLFNRIFLPAACFIASAIAATGEEGSSGWLDFLARGGFMLGLLALFIALFLFGRDVLHQGTE
jgi:hypothetical protein